MSLAQLLESRGGGGGGAGRDPGGGRERGAEEGGCAEHYGGGASPMGGSVTNKDRSGALQWVCEQRLQWVDGCIEAMGGAVAGVGSSRWRRSAPRCFRPEAVEFLGEDR